MRRVHGSRYPPMAIDILRDQQQHTGNLRLVFPASTSLERPVSENTLNQALRRMGFEKTRSDLPRLSRDRVHAVE